MKRSEKPKKGRCFCPYCDKELAVSVLPYCGPCDVTLRYCARCQIAVVKEAEACPQCGGELEWK